MFVSLAISFRPSVACGQVIPCSVVGHIFRNVNPSPFPNRCVHTDPAHAHRLTSDCLLPAATSTRFFRAI